MIRPTIQLGKRNLLKVLREVDFGMYLDGGEIGDILLPRRYIPDGTAIGDVVDVFLAVVERFERRVLQQVHCVVAVRSQHQREVHHVALKIHQVGLEGVCRGCHSIGRLSCWGEYFGI